MDPVEEFTIDEVRKDHYNVKVVLNADAVNDDCSNIAKVCAQSIIETVLGIRKRMAEGNIQVAEYPIRHSTSSGDEDYETNRFKQ